MLHVAGLVPLILVAVADAAAFERPPWELFAQLHAPADANHAHASTVQTHLKPSRGRGLALLATDRAVAAEGERELTWHVREEEWERERSKMEQSQGQTLKDMGRLEGEFEATKAKQAAMQERVAKESRLLRAFSSSAQSALQLELDAEAQLNLFRRIVGAAGLALAVAIAWMYGAHRSMKGQGQPQAAAEALAPHPTAAHGPWAPSSTAELTPNFGGARRDEPCVSHGACVAEEACVSESSPLANCPSCLEAAAPVESAAAVATVAPDSADEEQPMHGVLTLWKEPDLKAAGSAAADCQFFRLDEEDDETASCSEPHTER